MAVNSDQEHEQLPFWLDLKKVTKRVPPWGLYSLMAERPEVPLKLLIPTTFVLVPNEKVVARICTSLDGKLQIRRESRDTPVTFEMLETNMIGAYNARTSDHQPYICVVYSIDDDWTPHFVTKDNFSLLTLHLRASAGQNVSSYGREEQAAATLLFPERIACVQAYVPLQENKRFLSVFLCSPVKTLHEIHCRPYYTKAKVSTYLYDARELSAGELNHPLSRDDEVAKKITKLTAGIVSCLRRHRAISLPGFVCEYVQGNDGNVYMATVLRVSSPHVHYFPLEMPALHADKTPRSRFVAATPGAPPAPAAVPASTASGAQASLTAPTQSQTQEPSLQRRASTIQWPDGGNGTGSGTVTLTTMAPPSSHAANPSSAAAKPSGAPGTGTGTVTSALRKRPSRHSVDLTAIVEEQQAASSLQASASASAPANANAGVPKPAESERLGNEAPKPQQQQQQNPKVPGQLSRRGSVITLQAQAPPPLSARRDSDADQVGRSSSHRDMLSITASESFRSQRDSITASDSFKLHDNRSMDSSAQAGSWRRTNYAYLVDVSDASLHMHRTYMSLCMNTHTYMSLNKYIRLQCVLTALTC
jgi:hypothetical protein